MRKILRNKKALSPVVAAIILIAVTVAVSIAVAAWMGSLTIGFMETEELRITSIAFTNSTAPSYLNNNITVNVQNTGTTDISIVATVTVSGLNVTGGTTGAATVGKGESDTFNVILTETTEPPEEWCEGASYKVELLSSKGNKFSYTATAPT